MAAIIFSLPPSLTASTCCLLLFHFDDFLHHLDTFGINDDATVLVVVGKRLYSVAFGINGDDGTVDTVFRRQVLLELLGTLGGIDSLLRFGILQELTVQQTLAVTDHPYLSLQAAVDDGGAGESLLRVFGKPLHP